MSPTAGGSQARKRRGTTTGKNRGKGNQTRPLDDQQAAWDEALNAFLPMTTTEQVQRRDTIRDNLRAKRQALRDEDPS